MATLYVMVGIPGAGKTTWAKSHPELDYIGSDELRRELYGKEMTMRGYGRVHRIMTQQAISYLLAGRDVVVDSAHITASARRRLLKDIPPHVRRVAVFLHTPLKQAFHNNRQRIRHVPEAGITALHCLLDPPTKQEGFDEIIYVRYED